MWKCKGPRIAKAILKPKTPSDITTKALVIKIMRYWAMDRKDSPDTDLYRCQDGGIEKDRKYSVLMRMWSIWNSGSLIHTWWDYRLLQKGVFTKI